MPLPLTGVRVIELTQVLAGPYAGQLLGDLGAEVIKLEQPGQGDNARRMPPYFIHDLSAYYLGLNRNKKSLSLNIKAPDGKNIFMELVKKSDVVLDNFRPGVRERLGIDYENIKKVNPRIISCSISGFGQTGPYRDRPALDLIIQAMGGAMSFTGEVGREPVRMGLPMGDLAGALFAVHGILAALYYRERTGEGQNIDISMLDCQLALMTYRLQYYFIGGEVPVPIGSGHASAVPIRAYRCKDKYIVIDAVVERIWESLCRALGHPELITDPRFKDRNQRLQHREELDGILEKIFATRTRDEWMEIFVREGVAGGPIYTLDEVVNDPQIQHRQMVVDMDHPLAGSLKATGNPIKMSAVDKYRYDHQPTLGEHSDEILKDLLGCAHEEVARLHENGII